MTAHQTVHVDRSREIGYKILKSMVGKAVEEFTFKKSDQAAALGSKSIVKIKGTTVVVDPQLLFQRLLAVRDRCDDLPSLFTYELCSHPPALFESSHLPLQANKAVLADALWKLTEHHQGHSEHHCVVPSVFQYVLDGGALLHRLPWPQGSTYDSVCEMYVRYVTQKYGTATVIVFDGYKDEPSIKDTTHLRRTGSNPGVTVHFSGDMIIRSKKDEFLKNNENKQRFLGYLSDKLVRAGCITDHTKHDADVLIVQTAIASSRTKDTVLVGDDTDLLVLLLHHADLNAHELFLAPEPKKATKTRRIWCIKKIKELLGPKVCDNLLFIHAILGCDSTSRLFGIGKGLALKKVKNDSNFLKQAKVFSQTQENVEKGIIVAAGEKALVSLYGGDKDETLDMLRHRRFCDKVSKTTSPVESQTLPPTSTAAMFHSLRVFYQIMSGRGEVKTWNQMIGGGM